jgi:hypothetical protein
MLWILFLISSIVVVIAQPPVPEGLVPFNSFDSFQEDDDTIDDSNVPTIANVNNNQPTPIVDDGDIVFDNAPLEPQLASGGLASATQINDAMIESGRLPIEMQPNRWQSSNSRTDEIGGESSDNQRPMMVASGWQQQPTPSSNRNTGSSDNGFLGLDGLFGGLTGASGMSGSSNGAALIGPLLGNGRGLFGGLFGGGNNGGSGILGPILGLFGSGADAGMGANLGNAGENLLTAILRGKR